MFEHSDLADLPPLHMERLDVGLHRLLLKTQSEANARGYPGVVSGLLLLVAGGGTSKNASKLLGAIGTSHAAVQEAVDAEWAADSITPDRPPNVMYQAIVEAVSKKAAPNLVTTDDLLSSTLEFEDSMAARVVRRLGADASEIAHLLSFPGGSSKRD